MEAFAWVAGVITILIVWGVVAAKISKRRIERGIRRIAPELDDHIQANRRYNIYLSHGKLLRDVLFVGITKSVAPNDSYLPFPLGRWLVVELEGSRKAFIKPETVRYYEEAE